MLEAGRQVRRARRAPGVGSCEILADSKMTLDVYAQLEQRVRRDHGAGFDRLVRQARAQLGGGAADALTAATAEP